MHNYTEQEPFYICSTCGQEWYSREEFLSDPDICLIGYQVHFKELTAGLFLFDHSCKTTVALKVNSFRDLYDGMVFTESFTGKPECPGYCLHKSELRPCPLKCECAFVREIIKIINNWPKTDVYVS